MTEVLARTPQARLTDYKVINNPWQPMLQTRRDALEYVEPANHAQVEAALLVNTLENIQMRALQVASPQGLETFPELNGTIQTARQFSIGRVDTSETAAHNEKHARDLYEAVANEFASLDPVFYDNLRKLLPSQVPMGFEVSIPGDGTEQTEAIAEARQKASEKLYTESEREMNVLVGRLLTEASTMRTGMLVVKETTNRDGEVYATLDARISELANFFLDTPAFSTLKKHIQKTGATRIERPSLPNTTDYRQIYNAARDIALQQPSMGVFEARDWIRTQKNSGFIETPGDKALIQEIVEDNKDGKVAGTVICGGMGGGKTTMALRLIEEGGHHAEIISGHEYQNYADLIGHFAVTIDDPVREAEKAAKARDRLEQMDVNEWWQAIEDMYAVKKDTTTAKSAEEFVAQYCIYDGTEPPSDHKELFNAYKRKLNLDILMGDTGVQYTDSHGRKRTKQLTKEAAFVVGQVLGAWERGMQAFIDELDKMGSRATHGLFFISGLMQGDSFYIGGKEFKVPLWAKIYASANYEEKDFKDFKKVPSHQRPLFDRFKTRFIESYPDTRDGLLLSSVWLSDPKGRILLNPEEQAQFMHVMMHGIPYLRNFEGLKHPLTRRFIQDICFRLVHHTQNSSKRSEHTVMDAFKYAMDQHPYVDDSLKKQPHSPLVLAAQAVERFLQPSVDDEDIPSATRAGSVRVVPIEDAISVTVSADLEVLDGVRSPRQEQLIAKLIGPASHEKPSPGRDEATIYERNKERARRRALRLHTIGSEMSKIQMGPMYHAVAGGLDVDVRDEATRMQVYELSADELNRTLVSGAVQAVLKKEHQARTKALDHTTGVMINTRRPNDATLIVDYGIQQPKVPGVDGGMYTLYSVSLDPRTLDTRMQKAKFTDIGPVVSSIDGKAVVLRVTNKDRQEHVQSTKDIIINVTNGQIIAHIPDGESIIGMAADAKKVYVRRQKPSGLFDIVEKDISNGISSLTSGTILLTDVVDGVMTDDCSAAAGIRKQSQSIVVVDVEHPERKQKVALRPERKLANSRLISIGKHTIASVEIDNTGNVISPPDKHDVIFISN